MLLTEPLNEPLQPQIFHHKLLYLLEQVRAVSRDLSINAHVHVIIEMQAL